jgi:hypothetical protein
MAGRKRNHPIGQAKKEASDGRECKRLRRVGLERSVAELLVNCAVDLPFAIRMRISQEFADNALNENMRAPRLPQPMLRFAKLRHT